MSENLRRVVRDLIAEIGGGCYCSTEGMAGCDYCKYKADIEAVKHALNIEEEQERKKSLSSAIPFAK